MTAPRFHGSRLPSAVESIRCPRCASARAQSLAAVVRDWFCCDGCGHIWPRHEEPEADPDHRPTT